MDLRDLYPDPQTESMKNVTKEKPKMKRLEEKLEQKRLAATGDESDVWIWVQDSKTIAENEEITVKDFRDSNEKWLRKIILNFKIKPSRSQESFKQNGQASAFDSKESCLCWGQHCRRRHWKYHLSG